MSTRPLLDDPQRAVQYLADTLASPEREAFEEHYLAHPKVVEEMELDAKLKAGLIAIRDANELERLNAAPRRSWIMPIAIAASTLLAVGMVAFRYATPEAVLAASPESLRRPFGSQLVVAGAGYTLGQTRSGLYDAEIALPEGRQAIELRMVLDMDPPIPPLAVTLVAVADDGSRKELLTLHEQRADERGIITLYLNSAAVRPGIYQLAASREATPTKVAESTFLFEITGED